MSIISKEDVLGYTSSAKVIARGDHLVQDILRAEKMVFSLCGHQFTDTEKYPTIPEDVKLASILWTEYYALKETAKESEGFKSESFDDYSYQKASNSSISEPDTFLLLKDYVIAESSGSAMTAIFKMRAF